jgi:5,10-methylenetetrahydrofolate reductase
MEKNLTVAELIEILRKMPQGLEVEMAMNMEYQNGVTEDMVVVETYDGRSYVCITDTPRY